MGAQERSVGEVVPAQLVQFQQGAAHAQLAEQSGQREQRRAEREHEAVPLVLRQLAAEPTEPLVEPDVVAAARQQQCRDHPADSAADHDHLRHARLHAGTANAPIAAPPAAATRRSRGSNTAANASVSIAAITV